MSNSLNKIAEDLKMYHKSQCEHKPLREENCHMHAAALLQGRHVVTRGYNQWGVLHQPWLREKGVYDSCRSPLY